jgi:hypothetical protein
MVIGYGLVMGSLALGLRVIRRSQARSQAETGPGAGGTPEAGGAAGARPGAAGRVRSALRVVERFPPGWPRLIAHCLVTALGGYLLLMITLILYYFFVVHVAGDFVDSGFTGCALLIGLSTPVFLAASWLAVRKGWRF